LAIIKDFPTADYIFCNTKAFSPDQYAEKISELITTHNVSGGNIKSSQFHGTELVKFHQIINPAVADTLLGELMVNCYKLSSIKDFDYSYYKSLNLNGNKIKWDEVDLKSVGLACQPHNLPIIDCYTSDSIAVYCDQVRTFNFWGTAEWLNDYDLIFPLVILYLIKEYAKKGIVDRKSSLVLMKYFLNAMGPSLQRQIYGTSKAKPFGTKLKAELLDAIVDYLYAPQI
jgi:stress-induced morphogen